MKKATSAGGASPGGKRAPSKTQPKEAHKAAAAADSDGDKKPPPPRAAAVVDEQRPHKAAAMAHDVAVRVVAASTSTRVLVLALLTHLLGMKRVWAGVALVVALWLMREHGNELRDALPHVDGLTIEDRARPSLTFDQSTAKAMRPVVVFPGFITTSLELWRGRPCLLSDVTTNFRQRIFSPSMLLRLLQDPSCFLQHLALDPDTAGDPDGIKVRHSSGVDSVDFIDGATKTYWVWAKVVLTLADLGYEPRNLRIAAYDWRQDPKGLEARYQFFSRTRRRIESMVADSETATRRTSRDSFQQPRQKAVLIAHSYGAVVATAFLSWCDAQQPGWSDAHIHALLDIGGPLLGLPKATAALMSGEVRDTAMLPFFSRRLVDSYVDRRERANVFRSWPCLAAMLPRGPDGAFPGLLEIGGKNLTLSEARGLIRDVAVATNNTRLRADLDAERATHNEVPRLPRAPGMTVVCIYGVGLGTEVGYAYGNASADGAAEDDLEARTIASVKAGDGDATVPLVSLGYLCRSKKRGFATSVGRVVTVELEHSPMFGDPRGGALTGDHVDSMGNHQMLATVLRMVSGLDAEVADVIVSDIDARVAALDSSA
jgi:phospholipid:diacylglycerol acyltransferase